MKRSISARAAVLTLLGLMVLSMGIGSSVTYGYLSNTETANGSVSAANSFGSGSPPEGAAGWNDANGNGRYDDGESTYNTSELIEFEDESADLVITETTDEVYDRRGDVSITANSIKSEVDIGSRNGDVELSSDSGKIVLDGSSVSSRNGEVTISSSSDVTAIGATIESRNSKITISGENVDVSGSSLYSRNEDVSITASEKLAASNATIGSRNGEISLNSNGDMTLNGTTITSRNPASLSLGNPGATLSINDAVLDDDDNTIDYTPSDIEINGTPASGSVTPD